ncbi:MAG: [acyl-carrier-protein] S-malonyltransferase [Acidobacteria bacterium]|nr:MAG: [acyl-carrier-protein] S-malonyltransferase [Acidobacteriota bacterium]
MSKLAFVFPGQGSQYPGMGRELAESFPVACHVFEEADRALGIPLSKLCYEGPAEELQLTANTQPAILTASVAAAEVLEEMGIRPDYVAGHSLGEYSALVAARAIRPADAVRTVRKRGEYMQLAVPEGQGAMAALLGLEASVAEDVCRDAAQGEVVSPANLNSPGQVVIAGHASAVARAVELAKMRGARRAVMLNVSAPFHCVLMQPAAERLGRDLDALAIADPHVPLVNNADAQLALSAAAVRHGLKRQVTAPVRWEQSMRVLLAEGVQLFIEVGPGKVLSGLMRQIDRQAECLHVEDVASLNEVTSRLAM